MKKPILIILERDRPHRDGWLLGKLADSVGHLFSEIFYIGTQAEMMYTLLDPHGKLSKYPAWIRKPIKAALLLLHPARWSYYVTWFRKEPTIAERCEKLKKILRKIKRRDKRLWVESEEYMKGGREIVVLGRSSGGRVASLVASELEALAVESDPREAYISKIICIGYPFRHPEKADEPERYAHLEHMRTPFLILQGRQDPYGSEDMLLENKNTYKISPPASINFFDADHDFNVSGSEWGKVVDLITKFVEN